MTTDTKQPTLEYRRARISIGEHILFDDLDLSLEAGEFAYLTGAVGAGKSVLLKTIYAEFPISGDVARVLGYDLPWLKPAEVQALRRQLGIVFQDFLLLPKHTAAENLDIVLRALTSRSKHERRERIDEVLELVGLQTKGYKYPHELSGGEQQRVAIARAILCEPRIILADEPTANLDLESGLEITALLHRIARQYGVSVLMATHNQNVMKAYPALEYEVRGGQLLAKR